MANHKAIIIGMGNIGRRHLQGISISGQVKEIWCYDVNPEASKALSIFCRTEGIDEHNIFWKNDFLDLCGIIDPSVIVIVATTARDRYGILMDVIARRPLAVFAEKPVCLDEDQYQRLIDYAGQQRVAVYVDFVRRTFDYYRKIKSQIMDEQNIHVSAVISSVGFIASGVHLIDLAVWLSGGTDFDIHDVRVDQVFESKRKGFLDCYGELRFSMNNRHSVVIRALPEAQSVIDITVANEKIGIYEADGSEGRIVHTDVRTGLEQIVGIYNPFTSQVTTKEFKAIAGNGQVRLPTLLDCFMTHRILFRFLKAAGLESLHVT